MTAEFCMPDARGPESIMKWIVVKRMVVKQSEREASQPSVGWWESELISWKNDRLDDDDRSRNSHPWLATLVPLSK